ncbi:MAG: hypothetical protein JWM53_2606 [bacterium]|nr:hypothetical protein [bacterium]
MVGTVSGHDEAGKLVMAADELELGNDGAITAVARNKFEGNDAAFGVQVKGGLQPSRVAGAVNPLAHVIKDGVVLSSVGEATERFLQAVAVAFDQEIPPSRPQSRWKKLFDKEERPLGLARFSALLVTREGDANYPRTLHLKLFCEGGELYFDVDLVNKRMAIVEKDPEFRPAVWRALSAMLGPPA